MNILYAVLVLGLMGCLFGLVLAIASKVFEVKEDPRLGEVLSCLPGANCGGCGYPGCGGCAAAIVAGKAPVNACPGCSSEGLERIASIMGVEAKNTGRRVAFVRCAGGCRATRKFDKYVGLDDCVAAARVASNGYLNCSYGCFGLGNCVKACKFDAIHINEYGVAEVDREKCTNCKQCVAACPRNIIATAPYDLKYVVPCSNRERGAKSKFNCSVSCVGCRLCEKSCPSGAITVSHNVAFIDVTKCTSCGTCVEKCPRKVIMNIWEDGKMYPTIKTKE